MPQFSCEVVNVTVGPHPSVADLELIWYRGHQVVDQAGTFKTGDKAVYVPAGAEIPADLAMTLGLGNSLGGAKSLVIEPFVVGGIKSEGIFVPAKEDWSIGADVQNLLPAKKYIPPLTLYLDAAVSDQDFSDLAFEYVIRDFRSTFSAFKSLEEVTITENLHGAPMVIGVLPNTLSAGRVFASTPRLLARGRAFDLNQVPNNAFIKTLHEKNLTQRVFQALYDAAYPVLVFGQVIGGVFGQMNYGLAAGQTDFYVFDMARIDNNGEIQFADDDILDMAIEDMGLKRVPILYRGPFVHGITDELANGAETLSGRALHIRKGAVVRAVMERLDDRKQRLIFSAPSERYTLVKRYT